MPQSDDQFDGDWSDSDEPLPVVDSKKGFADRAKQEEIRQALRAACEVFVRVNNHLFSQMGSEVKLPMIMPACSMAKTVCGGVRR